MKVALIAPPYPLAETPTAPLGLCYVAAAFEAAKAEVIILDYIVRKYSPEKMARELKAFNPDIIGITSVTMNFNIAASILKTAKESFPQAVTVMGGPHVTFDYENTLKEHPEIDLLVLGEGEQTIMELAPLLRDRKSWPLIKGIAFMEENRVFVTEKTRVHQRYRSAPLSVTTSSAPQPVPGPGVSHQHHYQQGLPQPMYFLPGAQNGGP